MRMSTDGICTTEGCNEPIKAKGLCVKHHQRWYRAKNRTTPPRRRCVCSIVGCGKLGNSKDIYCRNHQRRFELYNDPLLSAKRSFIQKHCDVPGCKGVHTAKGLCKKHYSKKKREFTINQLTINQQRLVAINEMIRDPAWDDLLKLYTERKFALTN